MKKNTFLIKGSVYSILVLLVVTGVASSGSLNEELVHIYDFTPPGPGDLKEGYEELRPDMVSPMFGGIHPDVPVSFSNDIVELIEQIDEDLMYSYIENITSFGPRVTTSEEIDNSSVYIYNEFESYGLDVRYQEWEWEDHDLYGKNIEATLPGTDPESNFVFVVGGHYDSVPGAPGADDDASGVAATLAAAKIMSQYEFDHTVKFVTFSGEEQGLVGSYYYVEEAYNNGDQIVGMLNADMISYAGNEIAAGKVKIYENEESEWLTTHTDDIAQMYLEYIELDVIPSGMSSGSDHYRFWEFGYDAIFYFEYTFNPFYHSPQDILENCNMTYAKRIGRLILATLADLAQSSQEFPIIQVSELAGGFGASALVSNVGTADATDVDWKIEILGRLIILGAETNGTIPTISVGESILIETGLIFGLGNAEIIATADGKHQSGEGFVLAFFILGVG